MITAKHKGASAKLEVILKAAEKANWDALSGPPRLRAGQFHPGLGERSRKGAARRLG